jgi:GNAT superfamily N-acetyltransferase
VSLYSDYVTETNLKKIIEKDWGFATYHFRGAECYIEDIYVVPEQRKSDCASSLAQEIEQIAKAAGCKYLTGSVNTSIKDPTTSIRVLLAYGFKFLKCDPSIIWFVKEL